MPGSITIDFCGEKCSYCWYLWYRGSLKFTTFASCMLLCIALSMGLGSPPQASLCAPTYEWEAISWGCYDVKKDKLNSPKSSLFLCLKRAFFFVLSAPWDLVFCLFGGKTPSWWMKSVSIFSVTSCGIKVPLLCFVLPLLYVYMPESLVCFSSVMVLPYVAK